MAREVFGGKKEKTPQREQRHKKVDVVAASSSKKVREFHRKAENVDSEGSDGQTCTDLGIMGARLGQGRHSATTRHSCPRLKSLCSSEDKTELQIGIECRAPRNMIARYSSHDCRQRQGRGLVLYTLSLF